LSSAGVGLAAVVVEVVLGELAPGQRKIRVAVVFGGRSNEHAVSCASAGLVLSAIRR